MKRERQLDFPGLPPKLNGSYVLTIGRGWVPVLHVERVEDLLPGMLEELRTASRRNLEQVATGDGTYFVYMETTSGEPEQYYVFITKRAAEEIWPTH